MADSRSVSRTASEEFPEVGSCIPATRTHSFGLEATLRHGMQVGLSGPVLTSRSREGSVSIESARPLWSLLIEHLN